MLEIEDAVATGDDDMAKKAADERIVNTYVSKLRDVGHDRTAFDRLMADLKDNKEVGAAEVVGIASQYAGKRFGSKKAALEGLAKRFVDLVRTSARLEIAAKERIM